MIIAGALIALIDLAYRAKYHDRRWFAPDHGGSLFLLPAWTIGILWLILGIVYALRGQS